MVLLPNEVWFLLYFFYLYMYIDMHMNPKCLLHLLCWSVWFTVRWCDFCTFDLISMSPSILNLASLLQCSRLLQVLLWVPPHGYYSLLVSEQFPVLSAPVTFPKCMLFELLSPLRLVTLWYRCELWPVFRDSLIENIWTLLLKPMS